MLCVLLATARLIRGDLRICAKHKLEAICPFRYNEGLNFVNYATDYCLACDYYGKSYENDQILCKICKKKKKSLCNL